MSQSKTLGLLIVAIMCTGQWPSGSRAEDPKYPITTKPCTPDDFIRAFCIMECSVDVADITAHNLTDWCWQYYSTDPATNVTIFDGTFKTNDIDNNRFVISLEVTKYYSGYYVCTMLVDLEDAVSANFSVVEDPETQGVALDEPCVSTHDCLALESTCVLNSYTCRCDSQYNMKYTDSPLTPACLQHESEGSHCNSNVECPTEEESFECIYNVCACPRNKTAVAENDNQLMCILPVTLMGNCTYDEECQLNSKASFCQKSSQVSYPYCDCVNGYAMDTSAADPKEYKCIRNSVGECTTDNFEDNASCTLWCSLNDTNYNYNNYIWIYYTTDEMTNYTFDKNTAHSYDEATKIHNITLTLSDYNAGHYRCQFLVEENAVEDVTFFNFQLTETDGAKLNASCNSDGECLALNAVCSANNGSTEKICQCKEDLNVPFNDKPDAPACLTPADFNAACQSDDQCRASTSGTVCIGGFCVCENSDYELDADAHACAEGGLSGGAIAGIVIGTLAGVAIIGVIIYFIVK